MQTTPAQQELLRSHPQYTQLDLFIFQPRTVFQARVNNASIAKGAITIDYNTVTLGSYTAIEAGMTLLVGLTLGGQELGNLRIRSATSSQIIVSENSTVDWANGAYLTVLRFFDIWPVYPRIISDPSNPENVIFYKDYDIPYSNQNSILGTFVCMGPHRPVLIEQPAGTGRTWWSSTGTYNLLGHSLSYSWAFEGGTPTGSSSADPGYVTYNTPGDYVTRLIVTDLTNGAQDTSYRYVSVKNRIGEGSTTPVVKWEMGELTGSRNEGGNSVSIDVYDQISIDTSTVVMLRQDNQYGNTLGSIGGNYPNSSEIFFVGMLEKDSIHYDYQTSKTTLEVLSASQLMKNILGFSVSVQSVAAPSTWFELLDLDIRRALYHYMKWHSTIMLTKDFQFMGTDYPIQYFDSDRESLFDAVDGLMRSALMGQMVEDRQGKLWAEVNAMAYSNPTGTFSSTFQITKRDWMGMPAIEELIDEEISYIEYGGIQYSGVNTGTFAPLLACAPGQAPAFRGKVERQEGFALGSQAQLNYMVGNVLANKNSRYPTINMQMTENLNNLDIAPQGSVQVIIQPEDTNRNIALNRLYLPETQTWSYDPKTKILLPKFIFRNILSGMVGETISIPDTPVDGGFEVPGIEIPPLPILTVPPSLGNAIAQPYAIITVSSINNDQSDLRDMTLISNTFDLDTANGQVKVQIHRSGIYMAFCSIIVAPVTSGVVLLEIDNISASGDYGVTSNNQPTTNVIHTYHAMGVFKVNSSNIISATITVGGSANSSEMIFHIFRISA